LPFDFLLSRLEDVHHAKDAPVAKARADIIGSGSHEHGCLFKIVTMEKKVQARMIHEQGCARKRAFCEQTCFVLEKNKYVEIC
jgi:hypothetical protein